MKLKIGDLRQVDYGRTLEVWDGKNWVELNDPRLGEEVRKKVLSWPQLMVKDLINDLEGGDRTNEVMEIELQKKPQREERSRLLETAAFSSSVSFGT